MQEIILIAGMFFVTFFVRYILFAFAGRIQVPDVLQRSLAYVPPAVLTAIIVPSVLIPSGDQIQLNFDNAYLVAAVAAIAVGFWKQNLLLTIVIGMVSFLLWGLII